MTLARRFYERFLGLERVHGVTVVGDRTTGRGKREAKSWLEREPLTEALWREHLAGERGLGVVPIMDDDTCVWGALDVDEYKDLDLKALEREVTALAVPLVVCRTKSGGAHLYLFLADRTPAEVVRNKLMEWAVALGRPDVEVFPKQARLASDKDVGNWLNMPYFGGDRSTRVAVRAGKALTAEEFLDLADAAEVDPAVLPSLTAKEDETLAEVLAEGPPCLYHFASRGVPEGSRNDVLFNLGVYLRKRYGEGWEPHLDEYNERFMDPPLGHKEVAQVAKSVNKKTYGYTCNRVPLKTVCAKQICLTREFGIGGAADDPGVEFGTMTKVLTEPVTWIWDINGRRCELTTADLQSQARFHRVVMEKLSLWPQPVKPTTWHRLVNQHIREAEEVTAPPDASPRGRVLIMLEDYLRRSPSQNRDELLIDRPYVDQLNGVVLFTSKGFKRHLEHERFKVSDRELWAFLRAEGAEHQQLHVKKRCVWVWSVPAFAEQEGELEPPHPPGTGEW